MITNSKNINIHFRELLFSLLNRVIIQASSLNFKFLSPSYRYSESFSEESIQSISSSWRSLAVHKLNVTVTYFRHDDTAF